MPDEPNSSVYPSGSAAATARVPMVPPLPGPGDPVDPLRGSRIESIKRHPTDPELALVTRINPDQVVGPFASVSVEFYDEAGSK